MLNRRSFIASTAAFGATAAVPAWAAQTAPQPSEYVVPEEYMPTLVNLSTPLPAGQIHVDPNQYRLYWTLPDNKAIRYTIGVARPGLYESGTFTVGAKKEWPSWTPTPAMIEREPHIYAKYSDGMPGGPKNPLGARALYLFDGNRDTYLRIHGTYAPQSIATSVSNGCARLTNEHVIDLYNRVPKGTTVVLHDRSA